MNRFERGPGGHLDTTTAPELEKELNAGLAAANGDQDAEVLAKNMGLTLEATQNSKTTTASPEQVLGGTIMLESRYRTMARLAEESGYTQVDVPCGYTPRAIAFAKKDFRIMGWICR